MSSKNIKIQDSSPCSSCLNSGHFAINLCTNSRLFMYPHRKASPLLLYNYSHLHHQYVRDAGGFTIGSDIDKALYTVGALKHVGGWRLQRWRRIFFRKLRTSSRSETQKTRENRISQQSSGEVAIAIPRLFSLQLFSSFAIRGLEVGSCGGVGVGG